MARYKSALPTIPKRGYFKKGDKGTEVGKLQRALNWATNGTIVAALKVDNEVGPLTIRAVMFLQEIQHLTIDGQFGPKCRDKIKTMEMNGAVRACNFAVSVAKDNRFTYGSGERALRSGCYFCKTNVGPVKKKKEKKGEPHVVKDKNGNGHTYERTYCCNTLITAAYAHGAKDPTILKICKSGSCCGMEPADWLRSKNFKKLGKCKSVDYDNLKMGDVILTPDHVWMYLGKGRLVEASGNNWTAESISTKSGAHAKYTKAENAGGYVMRYTA